MKKIITILFAAFLLSSCQRAQENQNSTKANELTILAGSELSDMEPLLNEAQKALNVSISVKYVSTVEAVDQVKSGANYDVTWLSQAKYFYDTKDGAAKIKLSEKTMLSPVVVGVRKGSYGKLSNEEKINTTWSTIASWVPKYKMTYAMTDPSQSNTGYTALMGLTYATANTGENLKSSDVNAQALKQFFTGHTVNSGSSGWLVQSFEKSNADFMINYEASILQYNKSHPNDQLEIVYPFEGIVTADYPLMLLNKEKTEIYKKLAEFLKSEQSQQWIIKNVSRRAIIPSVVNTQTTFPKKMLIEMPFNPDAQLAENILMAYYQELKKPAAVIFVLDTSGSMSDGTREQDMKKAIEDLTVNSSADSRFAKLRSREKIWILPFSSEAYGLKSFEISEDSTQAVEVNKSITQYVNSLSMNSGTAMYSSVLQAYQLLQQEMKNNPQYSYSIIVLTDGESNEGISAEEFTQYISKGIRIFPVLFGNGNKDQLDVLAKVSNGKVFDGTKKSLSGVFKEIRSYQ